MAGLNRLRHDLQPDRKSNVTNATTQLHRKSGSKPPLSLVIGANITMIAVWIAIYTVAGGPIWLW